MGGDSRHTPEGFMKRTVSATGSGSCCAALMLAVLTAIASSATAAESYPSRPIRLVNPSAPGGAIDLFCRATAQRVSESLGQRVIVDNRPGAGGTIGIETRRPGAGRRIHTPLCHLSACNHREPVPEAQLQPGQGPHGRCARIASAAHAGRPSIGSGTFDAGGARARAGQARRAPVCIVGYGHDHAPRARALQTSREGRDRPRAI